MRISPRLREKPSLPTYYTARPTYIATLLQLEELTRRSKKALEQIFVLPPNSAPLSATSAASTGAESSSVGGGTAAWLAASDIAPRLGMANLKASQYRNIIAHLTALARYRGLVEEHLRNADPALAREVEEALQSFAKKGGAQDKQGATVITSLEALDMATAEQLDTAETNAKKNKFVDEHGRAYAFGRRKESSARVWIIPTFPSPSASSGGTDSQAAPTIGQVLVNSQPLSNFFSRIDHREKVTWPLKLAGKLGVFNIFALVRGGGNSGQAGAVAHGIAKALVVAADAGFVPGANEEEVERIKSVLMKGEWRLLLLHTTATDAELLSNGQTASSAEIQEWWRGKRRESSRRERHLPGSRDEQLYLPLTVFFL